MQKTRKGKGMVLYSAVSSPLDRSKRFTLFALPDRPVHSDTNSASPGSILAMQQLRNDYSLTCPPLSIARYSFIQLSRLRHRETNENAQTSKRGRPQLRWEDCVKRDLRKAEEEEKWREKANNRDQWKRITKVAVHRSDQ